MSQRELRQSTLQAFLDEALPPEEMADVEKRLRDDPSLVRRVSMLNAQRESPLHTLGGIWRNRRITCLSREELGAYLLDALPADRADYVDFHLKTIGCRYCRANLEDLRAEKEECGERVVVRRKRYFESSAGYLPK